MPAPLVPRPWWRSALERIAPDGVVERPLDVDAALREVEGLVAQGVTRLAICLLHAYANAAHVRMAAEATAKRFPALSISISSDLAPEIREYPRMVTTAAKPMSIAETYLDTLEAALKRAGIPGGLFLMLSHGGLTHVAEAERAPVQLLESDPAADALAGAWFGLKAGDTVSLATPGGGGHGDPRERPATAIARDVAAGYVTDPSACPR
jgi:N-methylhydantoinase A